MSRPAQPALKNITHQAEQTLDPTSMAMVSPRHLHTNDPPHSSRAAWRHSQACWANRWDLSWRPSRDDPINSLRPGA